MHIFPLNGSDKKPKQNISKTKQHLQQQEAKSACQQTIEATKTFFGMLSQGLCIDWLVCIAYCFFLAFDWLRPAVLFFLRQFAYFVKESPPETIQINQ